MGSEPLRGTHRAPAWQETAVAATGLERVHDAMRAIRMVRQQAGRQIDPSGQAPASAPCRTLPGRAICHP